MNSPPAFSPTTTATVDLAGASFSFTVNHAYGDLNCDGSLNGLDIDPFVLALTNPSGYAAQYPSCDATLADANGDRSLNGLDIDSFVTLLTDGK